MNSECRQYLKKHIETFLKKYPHTTIRNSSTLETHNSNKRHNRGLRKVAARTEISVGSLLNILKKKEVTPYHKRKVQGMTEAHKQKRVAFCKWMLKQYGKKPETSKYWKTLVNRFFCSYPAPPSKKHQ